MKIEIDKAPSYNIEHTDRKYHVINKENDKSTHYWLSVCGGTGTKVTSKETSLTVVYAHIGYLSEIFPLSTFHTKSLDRQLYRQSHKDSHSPYWYSGLITYRSYLTQKTTLGFIWVDT